MLRQVMRKHRTEHVVLFEFLVEKTSPLLFVSHKRSGYYASAQIIYQNYFKQVSRLHSLQFLLNVLNTLRVTSRIPFIVSVNKITKTCNLRLNFREDYLVVYRTELNTLQVKLKCISDSENEIICVINLMT